MVVNAPERSMEQRFDALDTANKVRTYRAKFKKDLKAGKRDIHDAIQNPPDMILTMKLWDLMMATPKFGRVKVQKTLASLRISPSKTVGGLTERQRFEICAYLRRR